MSRLLDIIVVTFNNPQYAGPCLSSIINTGILNLCARLIVVNNGDQPLEEHFQHYANTLFIKTGSNVGWEAALKVGLERSDARFVVFQNDDTFIPRANCSIYDRLLIPFADPRVGLVGPVTTVASGVQSIYHPAAPRSLIEVPYAIFFMVMVRREALDAVGGIDASLPGGDDFDLSIRLRQAGYSLVVNPDAFLIHEAFKTGERVHGGPNVDGGWNSRKMREETNAALIRKHGFKTFYDTIAGQPKPFNLSVPGMEGDEKELIMRHVVGDRVVEVGCGPTKLVDRSIGVDIAPLGEVIKEHEARRSVADVVADVTKPLPLEAGSVDSIIASHIFEHCLDSVGTLRNWHRVLRDGGRLIIAVPDEEVTSGIPLNPEHCHAFDGQSLQHVVELCGFKQVASESAKNGVSFVACFEKNGH